MRTNRGVLIATAAASFILAGTVRAAEEKKTGGEMVHCAGVNACKGQGGCASAENSCMGKNACKGKGWMEMSAEDCQKKGGKEIEPKKKM